MKKLLLSIGLAAVTLTGFAQPSGSPHNRSLNFTVGGGFWITNLTTINFADTNVVYSNSVASSQLVFSLTSNYSTNNFYTNGYLASGTLGTNANTSYGAAWIDEATFSDMNGNNASATISGNIIPIGNSTSNSLTLVFRPLTGIDASGVPINPDLLNKFQITVLPTSIPYAFSTNIPTALFQGSTGWRLMSAQTTGSTNGAQGLFVNRLSLNGFVP